MSVPLPEWRSAVRRSSDAILRALRDVLDVDSIEVVPVESWNAIFRVSGGHRAYCLKVMNEATVAVEWTEADLDHVGAVVNALDAARAGAVLPPVRFPDGRYSITAAGYRVVAFPWWDGPARERGGDNRGTVAAMEGRMLHEFHQAGRPVAGRYGERPSRWPRVLSAGRFLAHADEIWSACELRMQGQGAPAETVARLRSARELVAGLAPMFASAEQATVLHGDFRPENLVLGPERVELVYDFDFVHIGRAEEDVAYAALYLSGRSWFSGARDWQIVAEVVRSYQRRAAELGAGALDGPLLIDALRWTVAKELAMSEVADLVPGRYQLLAEIEQHAKLTAASCE